MPRFGCLLGNALAHRPPLWDPSPPPYPTIMTDLRQLPEKGTQWITHPKLRRSPPPCPNPARHPHRRSPGSPSQQWGQRRSPRLSQRRRSSQHLRQHLRQPGLRYPSPRRRFSQPRQSRWLKQRRNQPPNPSRMPGKPPPNRRWGSRRQSQKPLPHRPPRPHWISGRTKPPLPTRHRKPPPTRRHQTPNPPPHRQPRPYRISSQANPPPPSRHSRRRSSPWPTPPVL